ncbi:MAG: DUF1800 domain-containing protein [Chloroflexi bacterium]|nr:MAG: DUF1800 domain-containing protein [Chloroflexota bacterium]
MDHVPTVASSAPARMPAWKRRVSRRTVLATGGAAAAATAVAVLWKGNDLTQVMDRVRDLTHGYPGALRDERVRVSHLLRRAGFGATPGELDRYATMGTTAATTALLDYQKVSNAALDTKLPIIDFSGARPAASAGAIQGWWLQRMTETARPLEEKMTLFWHGLLTSGLDKAGPAQVFTQNALFRSMALGNFDDLLKAVSKDPAMMVYLDTETNRKGKPNENYARELMELFTTGVGHYTEIDVRESARAFTGWTLTGARQLRLTTGSTFVPRLHDDASKTFMRKTGNFTGDDIIEMLVPLRATAERLSTNAFYSEKVYRALVKSPAELVAQTIKASGADERSYVLAAQAMAPMGQLLFYPPNVAGWPGGTSWINGSTLLARINFANAAAQRMTVALPAQSLDQLLHTLVDANVSQSTKDALQAYAKEHPGDQAGLLFMVMATPEFQLN